MFNTHACSRFYWCHMLPYNRKCLCGKMFDFYIFTWFNFRANQSMQYTKCTFYENYTWLNFRVFFTFAKIKSQQTFPVIRYTVYCIVCSSHVLYIDTLYTCSRHRYMSNVVSCFRWITGQVLLWDTLFVCNVSGIIPHQNGTFHSLFHQITGIILCK